ncbi:high-affinity branched-chain amino acid transport ATP-binding protein LivF [Paraburkholderia xenovorans LB400]|uniref:Amino acid/amide ABC transporter ATP-binding protein 2, HAAT family n=1 Tax=Paraburkholderia xenovorans (strain LB400) TaxID=266265 RepID=Q13GP5_PARXL|nr:ABC transporter ATP-binding protein [Paraburkholderia xenovorans]ABE36744.1 amino acid/amide ABC transporter ATP-binding protein 2, HAAT family [Paraburkholderia xenovorans LB400]AIP33942.1 high-affinity branched-chain amino acid transport ATP-binding protein LivF [Paraburkholderia xenovorans LB400]
MLELIDVHAGYGDTEILHGVSLEVRAGTLVALVGGNAAGKSTLAGSVAGTVPVRGGRVLFEGRDLASLRAHERARAGIVLVPEGRKLFPQLSVEETLLTSSSFAPARTHRKQNIERMYALFPRLVERRKQLAATMSGGEQQMLAIARGLMSEPRLLILDEPSLGLAPMMVEQIFVAAQALQAQGLTILLIEQHLNEALKRCDFAYVVENGCVVLSGSGSELLADARLREAYLGKSGRVAA